MTLDTDPDLIREMLWITAGVCCFGHAESFVSHTRPKQPQERLEFEWATAYGLPERPARQGWLPLTKIMLAQVSVVTAPIVRERSRLSRAGRTRRTMLLQKEPSPYELAFRRYKVRGMVRVVEPPSKQGLWMMDHGVPLVEAYGEVDILPDRKAFVVPADRVEAGFSKQGAGSHYIVTAA